MNMEWTHGFPFPMAWQIVGEWTFYVYFGIPVRGFSNTAELGGEHD